MAKVRFLTDEDIYGAIAPAMRKAGFDAVSTPEAGRRSESDESQLAWAQVEGRAIVTFNVAHFAALHTDSHFTSGLRRDARLYSSSPLSFASTV